MYIKTRVFSFEFVNKHYSTLDPLQRTGTLLVKKILDYKINTFSVLYKWIQKKSV